MKVVLLNYTDNPEKAIALAARLCYSPKSPADLSDTMTSQEVDRVLSTIINSGHGSALEHATFTFGIEGVSRACTHQLVRHRLASFNQQSQRYVTNKDSGGYVTPPSIEDFENSHYMENEISTIYHNAIAEAFLVYSELIKAGVPKEDARYILPNAVCSNIVITMNVRELLHFFNLRTCYRAQWEIREVAEEMLKLCKQVAPKLFANAGPDCVTGTCGEGKMSCGHSRKGEL